MIQLSERINVHFNFLSFLFFILWLLLTYNARTSILKKSYRSNFNPALLSSSSSSPESIPTLARVLYLFLCENQDEANAYAKAFPSITADVMFLCWKDNCDGTSFPQLPAFYAMKWSGRVTDYQPLVQLDPASDYIKIEPRVFIINERQLNLPQKTTWTTGRNMLYERGLVEERQQGWRWAYYTFGDGDIQVDCPIAGYLLQKDQIDGDGVVIGEYFRSLLNIQQSLAGNKTDQCFILFDTCLLSVSPAISTIQEGGGPVIYGGLLSQIDYHIDAMFNAFHRDALPFVLPYCTRYDSRSWWTSQAILIYRSICLYGHTLQFNGILITRTIHRDYPRGNPWEMDDDMNLVPSSLIPLQNYMRQERVVSALVLQNYGGWSLKLTSIECRDGHTSVDPVTCKVGGKPG